jgi:catechol 2,3-dioxygenase-like lactoylglutathione lyase family enzyme
LGLSAQGISLGARGEPGISHFAIIPTGLKPLGSARHAGPVAAFIRIRRLCRPSLSVDSRTNLLFYRLTNPLESAMAKLRHIAIQVPDLEKAAAFYEGVFGLKRLKKVEAPIGNAISLSDGVVNLTLLHFPAGTNGGKGGPDWAGLHHFGFIVDDENTTANEIKKHGGEFFMKLPQYPGVDAENKFKDPNGIVFDVTEHGWG